MFRILTVVVALDNIKNFCAELLPKFEEVSGLVVVVFSAVEFCMLLRLFYHLFMYVSRVFDFSISI